MFSNRPTLPEDFATYDISFEPMLPAKNGKRISAVYAIQQRLCQDALAGKRKAAAVILRYAREQEDARAKKQDEHGRRKFRSSKDGLRRATQALLLLAIGSYDIDGGKIWVEPWAAELALSRGAVDSYHEADLRYLAMSTRPADVPQPERHRWREREIPKRRSPEETRFKKGQSGNPKGRPRKNRINLPFSNYFEEVGTVFLAGKKRRMTRLQYVIYVLNMKAIKGDPCMTAVLAGKYLSEQVRRFGREDDEPAKHNVHPFQPDYVSSSIAGDPFEQMLRRFRITNPRTKSRVLLEPWVVEAALARLGEHCLTNDEQAEVLISTSKPATVNWPDWWEIRTHAAAKAYRAPPQRRRGTCTAYITRF